MAYSRRRKIPANNPVYKGLSSHIQLHKLVTTLNYYSNKAKTATFDNDMEGFPRDRFKMVLQLKELCICWYNIRILGDIY